MILIFIKIIIISFYHAPVILFCKTGNDLMRSHPVNINNHVCSLSFNVKNTV